MIPRCSRQDGSVLLIAVIVLADWNADSCSNVTVSARILPTPPIDAANGNTVRYVTHRVCATAGSANAANNSSAIFEAASSANPKRGELKYGEDKRFAPPPAEYYRISSRIERPRNTISHVETIVHF